MNNCSTRKLASHRRRTIASNTAIYIILIIMSIIWLFPFVYLILVSFADWTTYTFSDFIPKQWTLDNYARLFNFSKEATYPFWKWWLNTFAISLITAVIQTVLQLASAYALSRLRFKMRKPLMNLMLILGMFPGFLGMVIIYFVLKMIGLSANIYSLILIYISGSAMGYYIAKGYFDTVPKSLDEAAMIDGANKNTVFFKIILPLSKPIVVYTFLMAFVGPWGDYMQASYLAQGNPNMFNVAVGLQQMISGKNSILIYFPTFCAGGVLTSIPILALFFWLQKYYVEGVTGGAVKG